MLGFLEQYFIKTENKSLLQNPVGTQSCAISSMAFPYKFLVFLYLATKVSSIKVSRHQDHVKLSDWQVPVYFLNADIDPRNPPDNNAPDRDCVHTLADPKPLPEQVSTQVRTTGTQE